MKRVMLVGGGTGGHFYPLIAVAESLRSADPSVVLYYIGPNQYDKKSLDDNRIQFVHCPSGKTRRYFSLLNALDPFKVIIGFFVAVVKLYVIYPDVLFSKGGFTSVPVVLAAYILRIPIVIHESDTKPGRANKLASHMARYIGIAFEDTAQYFPKEKTALVGMPIRKSFFVQETDPAAKLGIPSDRPIIFVTGGSLGSVAINNLILDSLDELLPQYTVVHQTGPKNESAMQATAASLVAKNEQLERYFVMGTLSEEHMHLAQSAASLVISRAGAGTIFELSLKGKPAILIPIPEKISHDQHENAYAYARSGAASVMEEHNLTDSLLTAEIARIMGNAEVYAEMSRAALSSARHDAAAVIADTLLSIGNEHE